MSIDIAYYPHVLDLVLECLYAQHDHDAIHNLGLTSSDVHARVKRQLLQHVVHRRYDGETAWGFVWNSGLEKARVMDVHECDPPPWQGPTAPDEAKELAPLVQVVEASQPTVLRFFSDMHHRFDVPAAPSVETAIFNVDVHDSGFATVYPDDDLIEVRLVPSVRRSILHLRYDLRGMGDFGLAFEAPPSDDEHEVCVLIKQYDYGPRPKSPWQSTLLNNLATSTLEYLATHPHATVTLIGMERWENWCGSPFPDEDWEPTPGRTFADRAEKVKYCWDWMFETEFGRKYSDIEGIVRRVCYVTEDEFREHIGDELMRLVQQPPVSVWATQDQAIAEPGL